MIFTFRINEIPEGKSSQTYPLNPKSIDLNGYHLNGGSLDLSFDKSIHLIRVKLNLSATLLLTCDRSLKEFDHVVNSSYEVIFNSSTEHITVDEKVTVKPLSISSNKISLEEEVRDSILLQIPIKKLHPQYIDESGNETEFELIIGAVNDSDTEDIDPRWAKLKEINNK